MHRPVFLAIRSLSGILREPCCGVTAAYIIGVWNVLSLLSQAESPRKVDGPPATLEGSALPNAKIWKGGSFVDKICSWCSKLKQWCIYCYPWCNDASTISKTPKTLRFEWIRHLTFAGPTSENCASFLEISGRTEEGHLGIMVTLALHQAIHGYTFLQSTIRKVEHQ